METDFNHRTKKNGKQSLQASQVATACDFLSKETVTNTHTVKDIFHGKVNRTKTQASLLFKLLFFVDF